MRSLALVAAGMLVSSVALADEKPCEPAAPGGESGPPFAYPKMVRTLVGFGYVPKLPSDDRTANVSLTEEIGGHPLTGALGTGFSISSTTDLKGLWSVVTPGLFVKLDLTYLFLSGLWACSPSRIFPFRLQLGGRLGLGISESTRPKGDVPGAAQYVLLRPELQSFFDVEIPIGTDRIYSVVGRGAFDGSVNLSDVFRWSFSMGINYGWGP
jgi:hypothetical protein